MSKSIIPWVGIDLDGTLAKYDRWQGIQHIGEPIEPMRQFVLKLLRAGVEVRIFTARCQEGPEAIDAIETWCNVHLGQVLPVTDRKDFGMVFYVDDRAVSVTANTGEFLVQPPDISWVAFHASSKNPANPDYQADGAK